MRIGVDCDDFLAQYTRALVSWWNYNLGTNIDYDSLTSHRVGKLFGISGETYQKEVIPAFYSSDHFEHCWPVCGSQEAMCELSGDHELVLVTARPNETREVTGRWLELNFPGIFKERFYTSQLDPEKGYVQRKSKAELCRSNGIDMLLDDSLWHIQSCSSSGMPAVWLDHFRVGPVDRDGLKVELSNRIRIADSMRGVVGKVREIEKIIEV